MYTKYFVHFEIKVRVYNNVRSGRGRLLRKFSQGCGTFDNRMVQYLRALSHPLENFYNFFIRFHYLMHSINLAAQDVFEWVQL